jgi:hypothetical protein
VLIKRPFEGLNPHNGPATTRILRAFAHISPTVEIMRAGLNVVVTGSRAHQMSGNRRNVKDRHPGQTNSVLRKRTDAGAAALICGSSADPEDEDERKKKNSANIESKKCSYS